MVSSRLTVLSTFLVLLCALSATQAYIPVFPIHSQKKQAGFGGASAHKGEGTSHSHWKQKGAPGDKEFLGCATYTPSAKHLEAEETMFSEEKKKMKSNHGPGDRPPIKLPINFHVVFENHTQPGGMVLSWQIEQQIIRTNLDFAGTGISFELGSVTHNRNAKWFHTGVGNDYEFEKAHMRKIRAGDAKTINVYTVGFGANRSGAYGYAHYPSHYQNDQGWDGVLLNYATLPGGSEEGVNLGRVLTHEIGHWMGLLHTFEGNSCDGPGDYVNDTPTHNGPSWYCDAPMDTCPGKEGTDPVHNFMNYAVKDYCETEFTSGQTERMRDQLRVYRGVENA